MDIKDYRGKELKSYIIGNAILFCALSGMISITDYYQLADKSIIYSIAEKVFSGGVMSSLFCCFTVPIDAVISSSLKEKLSNLWMGKVGESIFDNVRKGKVKDSRINKAEFDQEYNSIFEIMDLASSKNEKKIISNSEWYKIYVKHEKESKIQAVHRNFLLCRDMYIVSLIFSVLYPLMCGLKLINFTWNTIFFALVEVVVTLIATRNTQEQFVYTVIAQDLSEISQKDIKD